MPKTPKRLAGPALVDSTVETVYTVPAVTKTIVRHIHVQNPSAGYITLTLSIGTDGAATRILDAVPIAPTATGSMANVVDFFCYYVLEAAEIIQADSDTDDILTLTINGDEFTLG